MAVAKAKVLAAIELKFKGKSLTKNFKDALATKWADKIETDDDIDSYVDDREDVILEASQEADRRSTEAAKKARETALKALNGEETTEPKDEVKTDDMPAWAKALLDQNKALADKVTQFEQKQSQQSITERFTKDERLKGINPVLLKGRIPKTDEEFESAIEEALTDLKDFVTAPAQGSKAGFGDRPGFKQAPTQGAAGAKKVDPQVTKVVEQIAKAKAPGAKPEHTI